MGCLKYRSKSKSLLTFNCSRFLFSSITVSNTLVNPLQAVYARLAVDMSASPSVRPNPATSPLRWFRPTASFLNRSRTLATDARDQGELAANRVSMFLIEGRFRTASCAKAKAEFQDFNPIEMCLTSCLLYDGCLSPEAGKDCVGTQDTH